ncbi:MAG TPA: arylsulfatase, partial [Planctomycetaceae bacterium]|nr:arylsulfatase [Planctomycetaceae bacterium]
MRWMVALTALFALVMVTQTTSAADKPNILFVLCDDLGYGDLSCLNPDSKLKTPHFDRIAAEGAIFTDAHSGSAVCSPTRYGVMTGRYAWRTKLQSGVLGGLSPRLIEPGRMTVASFLKDRGYHTKCIGKWHLGLDWVKLPGKEVTELNIESADQVHNVDYSRPYTNGPTSVGFDEYFGISASLDMVPYTFLRNDRVTVLPTIDKSWEMMVGRPAATTRLGPTAPDFHANQVLPALTAEAVKYIGDRAAAAKTGKPFFLYLPYASPHTPIQPIDPWLGKSGLNVYGDFVLQQDANIGELLKALDDHGLTKDTLVIITSDNGCSPQAKFDELLAKGHNPSHIFRGTKADIFEGGHRVPYLVRWPVKVTAGQTTDRLTCLTDFFATCADILGQKLPDNAAEDSVSYLPALLGQSSSPDRAVVHHSINGSFAIRQGDWKLALCPGSGGWSAPRPGQQDTSSLPLVQLFNLKDDIAEMKNLETDRPEVVKRLTQLLESFVTQGRSTPGSPQRNAVEVDIWKAGKAAQQPVQA